MEMNGPANRDVKIKMRIESACKIPLLDVKNKPTVIGNKLKIIKTEKFHFQNSIKFSKNVIRPQCPCSYAEYEDD